MIEIVTDSREQRPWEFNPTDFRCTKKKLDSGDYSLAGFEREISVERKSLGDLVGTVIGDWIRFRKELNRLSGYEFAAIVVEADVTDLWEKRYESDADPASVWGKCNSCLIDHGIPVLWWGSRKYCQPAAERLFKLLSRKFSNGSGT